MIHNRYENQGSLQKLILVKLLILNILKLYVNNRVFQFFKNFTAFRIRREITVWIKLRTTCADNFVPSCTQRY